MHLKGTVTYLSSSTTSQTMTPCLTREYSTWFCASAPPAVAASECVRPGSERGFCVTAAPHHTCLWGKRPPVWFLGPQPAAGLPLYTERCGEDLRGPEDNRLNCSKEKSYGSETCWYTDMMEYDPNWQYLICSDGHSAPSWDHNW